MGNATKVALVALLILMVVVVARFVREDTAAPDPDGDKVTGTKAAASTAKQPPESIASRPRTTSVNPGVRRVDPGAHSPATPTRPAEGQPVTRSGALAQAGTTGAAGPGSPSPTPSPPVSSPASGASASPQASTEPATAGVVLAGRPPAHPRTSNGESLPAPPTVEERPAPPATASGTGSGSAATPNSKAPAPGALVTTQLNENGGGGLSGGTSVRPAQPEPSTAKSGAEPNSPSYRDLAGAPALKSSEDPRDSSRAQAPGASGRTPSSGEYPKIHEVVKNDTFWGLAQKYYGDGRLGSLIEKENPGVRMQPGKKLSIPEPPARPSAASHAPPRSVARDASKAAVAKADAPKAGDEAPQASSGKELYVVQRGDTLGKIARKFYGDAGKTEPLEDANPHLKYQTLQAGAKIKIPLR